MTTTEAGRRAFVDCPPDCPVPADQYDHRHFADFDQPYWQVRAGAECPGCGRAWFSDTEFSWLDMCRDCLDAGVNPLSLPARSIYPTYRSDRCRGCGFASYFTKCSRCGVPR